MKAVSTARRLVGAAARASGLHQSTLPVTGAHSGPEILFDHVWYRATYGLADTDRPALLRHYREVGVGLGYDPHPLFETTYYLDQLDEGEACADPLAHFHSEGWARGLDPHPLFDTSWYLDHYPDVGAADIDPLIHYLEYGGYEGRLSSPEFDGGWYLTEYPDVADAGINPLIHYRLHGKSEGRFPAPMAKQTTLVAVNARVVDLGRSYGLSSTAWWGDPSLLGAPARPALTLDPAELTDHKVASFDVWDTLLHRRCHPEEVKLASARWLLLALGPWLRPELRSVVSLYRSRLAAEAKVSFGPDREYRFSEAAIAWVKAAAADTASGEVIATAVEGLLAHELVAETRATYRNQAMDPVLNALAGRTIVFASDFYMPSDFVQRLLTVNGVPCHFDRTFVSCEDGRSKRSGRMFTRLLDELGVDAGDVVHVGDNHASDVVAAEAAGLRAVHHEVALDRDLETAVAERIAGDDEAYEPLIGAALAATERGIDRAGDDGEPAAEDLRRLGVRFAPVAIGLALHVLEEAARHRVDTIFFFTREGVFLKRLVDEIIAADPYGIDYPETELLEVSRKATFAASLDGFDPDQLMRLWTVYSSQSPRGLVESLNLDEDLASATFARQGLDFDEPVRHPWANEQFGRALADSDLRRHAERRLATQRTALLGYLGSTGLDRGNPMIVDLGWRGTIQDNLARAGGLALRGAYLGLFRFLNDQPANSHKSGWLFDHNDADDDSWTVDEVAPLEMLFNAVGGSVTGYEQDEAGRWQAARLVDPDEEAVIAQRVVRFQEGILDALEPVLEVVGLHALTSAELRPLARKLVLGLARRPPAAVAEAFFSLSHNETFGTGVFEDMRRPASLGIEVAGLERHQLYSALADAGAESRWPEGLGSLCQAMLAERPGPRALHVPTEIFASSPDVSPDGAVGIFAPAPIVGSGGHRTIYNLARGIAATGLDVQLFLDGFGTGIDDVVRQLRGSGVRLESSWETAARFDYAIATVATSADRVEQVSAAGRGYLVQDFEAYFNPVSDGYITAESSYTDSFDFFTVGSWLGHVLETRYGSRAFSSGLGANHDVYRPLDGCRENAVCFLYQPEKPRRTPELGIAALKLLKRACPEVSVYVYGSEADIDLDFEVENLGLIHDLAELNDLYNRCKVGLCISMTNPSRIPFELMAAGVVPVDVYRYNTLFDYDDGTAALAYQSPASLAEAMIELLATEGVYEARRDRCLDFIAERPLGWETDVMVNTVLARISGIGIEPGRAVSSYTDDPIIAETDRSTSTSAFCHWQRRSAET